MDVEVIVGIVSAFISLSAIGFAFYTLVQTKRMLKYQVNIQWVTESEKALQHNSDLLSLHGINLQDLNDDNITIDEFCYILSSLRASEAYYVINQRKGKLSYYRANFLDNTKVKLVYTKYLRSKFFAHSPFIDLVDTYYRGRLI